GYAKVYYSTDRGQSWIESTNAPAKAFGASVSIGNTIFFSTAWNGVMITRNKGMTWTCTYDPKTGKAEGEVYATWIESIAGNGKDVFIVGNAYTYYTMNLGYSWILVGGAQYTTPGGNHAVMKDSTLMVDYFVSHNYGRTWSEVNN
ncbi:hypothetical protein JNL27_14055, partial [bacterium]|nr:hypothetical protein [bacterium]